MGKSDFLGNWCFTDNLDKPLDFKDIKIGEWVMVMYEGKKFLEKVFCNKKVVKRRCAASRSHSMAEL